ncbi:MAG: aminotransferase class III-fold pyridoxal phosphate-dependent enzyme, partial [Ktedonobacterales bacterium]
VMPIGAFMARPQVWQKFIEDPFIHTTTTGGNPLACAAAIATINVILEEDLPRQAAEKGDYMLAQLNTLAGRYDDIYERITGKGLLIGQHFHDAEVGYQVSAGLFRRGVLISGTLTNAKTIRIEPPLIIEYAHLDAVLNRLEDTLNEVRNSPVTGETITVPAAATPAQPQTKVAAKAATKARMSARSKQMAKSAAAAISPASAIAVTGAPSATTAGTAGSADAEMARVAEA